MKLINAVESIELSDINFLKEKNASIVLGDFSIKWKDALSSDWSIRLENRDPEFKKTILGVIDILKGSPN